MLKITAVLKYAIIFQKNWALHLAILRNDCFQYRASRRLERAIMQSDKLYNNGIDFHFVCIKEELQNSRGSGKCFVFDSTTIYKNAIFMKAKARKLTQQNFVIQFIESLWRIYIDDVYLRIYDQELQQWIALYKKK